MPNKILEFILIHYKLFKLLFRAVKKGFLHDIGWINSYKTKTPVNINFQPIPWVTFPFISYIENRLNILVDLINNTSKEFSISNDGTYGVGSSHSATRNSENLLIELLTNELLEEILAKLYTFSNDT